MGKPHIVIALLFTFVCTESLLLEGGNLRVEQHPRAVWDAQSQQWTIRLTCGAFAFQGPPPLNVTWTTPEGEARFSSGYESTPEGEARFSSGYESGRFFLHLNTPVQGGNYSCVVPGGHVGSNVSGSVDVDEALARVTLLEANQNTLEESLYSLQQRHANDLSSVGQLCQGVEASLEEQEVILRDLQHAANKSQGQGPVLSGACAPGMYSNLEDDWRWTEYELEGYDYECDRDLSPGWYRFYLDGNSAVMPTSCVPDHRCKTHAPMWLDLQGESLPEPGQEKVTRACANWSGDCCNWDVPITVRNCGDFFVYNLEPSPVCQLAYCAQPQ
ncbi:hypothetical protein ACOMHN_044204 [Nucella lapillus]